MNTVPNRIKAESESLRLSPNITSKFPIPQLEEQILLVFQEGKRERFEAGYKSNFARQIQLIVDSYGEKAIDIIASLILTEKVAPDAADEALRWIGEMRNPHTHLARRRLLELCLLHSSILYVRDGAGLGLASMDDPDALPAVKAAIDREANQELKGDLQQVYDELLKTQLERA